MPENFCDTVGGTQHQDTYLGSNFPDSGVLSGYLEQGVESLLYRIFIIFIMKYIESASTCSIVARTWNDGGRTCMYVR